jgi:ferredoxin
MSCLSNNACKSACSFRCAVRRHATLALTSRRQPARNVLRTRPMAFTITLDTPDGEKKIECDEDTYILDAADEAGLDLPYSCRSGSCGSCAAKVASGDISQVDQVPI